LEQWELASYRGRVANAIRGKRGQQFLKNLLSALDSIPNKRLIAGALEENGEFCAIGSLGHVRELDMNSIDETDPGQVGRIFNIARSLAAEVAYENDEVGENQTPEQRWVRVRKWVEEQIIKTK
jgi:hypothetical protein